jgi:hypothetical protein
MEKIQSIVSDVPDSNPDSKKPEWFERKFVNPRTGEGLAQTERLEYAREFFEEWGNKDPRFSGAALVGSTMKGYGLGGLSDIDVAVFYQDKPKREWVPESEFLGMKSPAQRVLVFSYEKDFGDFKEEFDKKRKDQQKSIFEVDVRAHDLDVSHYFKKNFFGTIKTTPKDLLDESRMFYELSYPIIANPNPKTLMPMRGILDAMIKTASQLKPEQKEELVREIVSFAKSCFETEFRKYSDRTGDSIDKEKYVNFRMEMFKQKLKNKFSLVI